MYKVCKVLIVVWTVFCALGLIVGIINVSDIQTTNEFEEAGAIIGVALGVGFWLALWFFPTVGLGIIALLTKPKDRTIQVLDKPTLCPDCGKYYTGSPSYCPNCGKKIEKG
jgi:hypothetical protein